MFSDAHDCSGLFSRLSDIFLCGLGLLCGFNPVGINIENLDQDIILKMTKYMQSIGIQVCYTTYSPQQLNKLYRKLATEIVDISDTMNISVVLNWQTQFVSKLTLDTAHVDMPKIQEHVKSNYPHLNYWLKIIPKEELRDFNLKFFYCGDFHVFTFNYLPVNLN